MEVLYSRCAGLDVHKDTVVACARMVSDGAAQREARTVDTTTSELLALADWLGEHGCTYVAMEATGVYWKPVLAAIDKIACRRDVCSASWSSTIRTARARTSGENLFVVLLVSAPPSQELEPPTNPGRISSKFDPLQQLRVDRHHDRARRHEHRAHGWCEQDAPWRQDPRGKGDRENVIARRPP